MEEIEDHHSPLNQSNVFMDNLNQSNVFMDKTIAQKDLFGSDDDDDETTKEDVSLKQALENDLFGSDSEENILLGEGLFGSDDEEDDVESKKIVTQISNDLVNESELFGEDDDDDNDEDMINSRQMSPEKKQVIVEIKVPELERLTAEEQSLFFVKMPNFLDIEPTPFDPLTYQENINEDDDEIDDDHIRLKVENTIRWRYGQNGAEKKSNARLIRWSDDSYSLLLGEELFDCNIKDFNNSKDFQYLMTNHPAEGILQTQARIERTMTFQPHGTKSITHKKLTMAMANKYKKEARTKMFTSEIHPEDVKLDMERMEAERERTKRRLESKQRSSANKYGDGLSGRSGLTERMLEEDSDEERYKRRINDEPDQYEDDFEEEMEGRLRDAKGNASNKRNRDVSSEEESEEEESDTDHGGDRSNLKKSSKKRVIAGSSSEDE